MEDRSNRHHWAVVDVEVGVSDRRIHDIGALRDDGAVYHGRSKEELAVFLHDADYVCGHNIINHDAKYLFADTELPGITNPLKQTLVDTLYMSPLLFPERPYHRLLKDDKLITEQMNNPVNDCEKARDLLMDEIACWERLTDRKRRILATLLHGKEEFHGFLSMVGAESASVRMSVASLWRLPVWRDGAMPLRTLRHV